MGHSMEITRLSDSSFSLKTKTAQLTINLQRQIEVAGIVINGPGEYEIKGFSITGHKGGVYLIEAEEIRLGYLTEKDPVDVLIANSWETVKDVQPSIVIPVDAAAAAVLVKASGLEPKTSKKLLLNKLSLPEETELVILEAK